MACFQPGCGYVYDGRRYDDFAMYLKVLSPLRCSLQGVRHVWHYGKYVLYDVQTLSNVAMDC